LCPCCGKGPVAQALVLWLEMLRRAWGAPVVVNSGWRCPAHNVEVGGTKSSRHMIGCAADLRLPRASNDAQAPIAPFIVLATRLFQLPGWEFRPYSSYIHVAVPREETSRAWDGDAIRL
jgi:uncharacterized protein YcbK (DUF882 family)